MAKAKPTISPTGIPKTVKGPYCVPNVVVSREQVQIVDIGERESLSRPARELFRKADRMPQGTVYHQHGVGSVPYFYRDPGTKTEGRVSIGSLLQDRALAVRVLDDQLKMALAHRNLFSRAGRANVAQVRRLAKILGMEKRFEERVCRSLAQSRNTIDSERAPRRGEEAR